MKTKKNKRLQYVLLMLVVFIWGAIAYQLLGYLKKEDPNLSAPLLGLPPSQITVTDQLDTFQIFIDYPDPFLSKSKNNHRNELSSKGPGRLAKRSFTKAKKTEVPPLPKVKYRGFSATDGQISRVVVDIEGKSYSMKAKDTQDGLTLIQMQKDSLVLSWQRRQLVIYRQKG